MEHKIRGNVISEYGGMHKIEEIFIFDEYGEELREKIIHAFEMSYVIMTETDGYSPRYFYGIDKTINRITKIHFIGFEYYKGQWIPDQYVGDEHDLIEQIDGEWIALLKDVF